jgi:hypothetical protein
MRFAAPELAALSLALASPALAARKPVLPPLPPLELSAAVPLIEVRLLGQTLRLTVDFGGDDLVQINPDSPVRAALTAEARAAGTTANRGTYRVAVGQTDMAIPYSRETLLIAGRAIRARVLTPAATPQGQAPRSDGTIGLPLLPHDRVTLVWRPPMASDASVAAPARIGRSDAYGFGWTLSDAGELDVELHPLRPVTVASAAAASRLAAVGAGRLDGPVRRVLISFGVLRPVRTLALAQPVRIAGLSLQRTDVRLFDWAGRSELPPDSDPQAELTVTGQRGRQGQWANVKLGNELIGRCASVTWRREPAEWILVCPAGN